MSNARAYTWFCVTYATPKEYQPLLDKARHWAYAHHDQDFIVEDNGNIKPKEPHTHIIVTFEQKQSFEQVRGLVESEQNTLAQPCNTKDGQGRECVRGMFKYLTHEGEDPTLKYIYDKERRRTDDDAYWKKRIGEDLTSLCVGDNFLDDLIAEDFSVLTMGRKYGRDFMKNYGRYVEYRNAVKRERTEQRAKDKFNDLVKEVEQLGIPIECIPNLHDQFINFIKHNKHHYSTKGKNNHAETYRRKL